MIDDSTVNLPKRDTSVSEGSVEQSAEPRFLVVGRILRPHGVRGEVRVEQHTSEPDRFLHLQEVRIGQPTATPRTIVQARYHQGVALLRFDGIDTRDDAELLRGQWLYVPVEDAAPLAEGEYYLYQLEGLIVYDTDGRTLGPLVEVIETGANNVFLVRGPNGDILLPDIPEVIQDIDFDGQKVIVQLLPGLVDPGLLGPQEGNEP